VNRYSVATYTDGPATRWNVIDHSTQEWVRRFASETEAKEYAAKLEAKGVKLKSFEATPGCKSFQPSSVAVSRACKEG
jgi:hypothetical protein